MKNLVRAGLMSAVMVVLMCGGVFAQSSFSAQGGAMVNGLIFGRSGSYVQNTSLDITNVTNEVVHCKVTFYDHDGIDITHLAKVYTGSAGSRTIVLATGTAEYDIPAHSTRCFQLDSGIDGSYRYCSAEILWSSEDKKPHKALIGTARNSGGTGTSLYYGNYPINNGQPF
ncbi:hypothetical protein [Maridesulfovibrio sp. FT414]|uniref:hypothetical protein n=1 Tax=Maridesulfovibrio sp. FT414 TaxID=2979469 RepID=UPI003D8076D4